MVTEVVIGRSVGVVAAYAGDPSNAPEWYTNIESVVWQSEPPVVVGSRMDFVAHFLGRRLTYTYEVVELVPGQRLVMRTAQGPFPMETSYEWMPEGTARVALIGFRASASWAVRVGFRRPTLGAPYQMVASAYRYWSRADTLGDHGCRSGDQ